MSMSRMGMPVSAYALPRGPDQGLKMYQPARLPCFLQQSLCPVIGRPLPVSRKTVSTGNSFVQRFLGSLESSEILMLAIFGGAMSFALLSASWLIRERAKMVSTNRQLKQSLADLRASNDRNEALVSTADQRIVCLEWYGRSGHGVGRPPRFHRRSR